jgi:putative membrane protein
MANIILRILVTACALFVAERLISGVVIEGLYTAVIAAVILGVLNVLVRPVLVVLTLPITLLTFGLFVLVINAALFWFVASFVEQFTVTGFVPALLGSLVVSGAHILTDALTKRS